MNNDRYLFRGFHKDEEGTETICLNGEKIKGKWVYGYYVELKSNKNFKDISYRIYTSIAEVDCDEWFEDYIEVIPGTVGQYTGLKDKNGKKIFENDVLNLFNTIGEVMEQVTVKWNSESACYEVLQLNGNHYSFDFRCAVSGCEVIGTIFDEKEVK